MGPSRARAHGGRVTTVAFAKSAPAKISKGKLGVYFAWGAFAKRDGELFVDAHGDSIPGDEFVGAALSLAKSAKLGHEHDGTVNGSVPLVFPLTEDIQAALDVTSPHAGLAVGFQPVGDLAASLEAGDAWELSIAGEAMAELVKASIAKAEGDTTPKQLRTLTKIRIDEISLVKAGAHGAGTRIAIAKRADRTAATPEPMTNIAKRAPALTTAVDGHQHAIHDTDEKDGCTSWDSAMSTSYGGHSHAWVKADDGTLQIAMAAGHTHELATAPTSTEIAMSQTPDLAKQLADALALTAAVMALPADQLTFAKRLDPAGLAAFVAKTSAERAAAAQPVYVAKSGEAFYAADDARLVSMAKSADAAHEELAKARGDAQVAIIAKAAAAIPHVKGAALLAKAVHLLPEAERAEALAALATVDATVATLTKTIGYGGNTTDPASPQAELDAIAADIAKTKGVSIAKAADLALDTPRGAQLYKQIEGAKRAPATA